MAVWKEWACAAHGPFDSPEGKCPYGCSQRFVVREFRTAPSIKGAKTKHTDRNLQNLANDFKLTDVATDKEVGSVMDQLRKKNWKKERPVSQWASVPNQRPGWVQRGEEAPKIDVRSAGVLPGVAVKEGTLPKVRPIIDKMHHYNAPISDGVL